jgi:hypothetical protein
MSDSKHPPFLIVASALPYESTGTSIVLRRLIENLRADEAVLLARAPNPGVRLTRPRLPIPAIPVRWLPLGLRGERFSRMAGIAPGLAQGLGAVRRHGCGAILAMFPDEFSLTTGYLLHRATGLPLVAYFCDLYLEDRRGRGWEAGIARWVQSRVLRAATRLITLNRGMERFYRERYGIEAVTVPTCINQQVPEAENPPPPGRPLRIAYSGNVNDTRISSLKMIVEAVGGDPDFAIRYFAPQSPAMLERLGVWAPNASAEFVGDDATLLARLRDCDVLFLPLTFEVTVHSRDQMATCFGTKAFEYFLAGRPVLVHCPSDYFMARFFHEGGCGLVVSEPSPEALRAALVRLRGDETLRQSVVRGGYAAAREFEGPRVVEVLRREMTSAMTQSGEKR